MESLHTSAVKQCTLKQAASCMGIGLKSGKMIEVAVKPAAQGTGINIYRTDISDVNKLIKASWENVVDNRTSIVLCNESNITVSNVEYLMAALLGCGVDNAIIELDGPEVPVFDGCAAPFVSMIETAGTIDQDDYRKAIWIEKAIEVRDGDKYVLLYPSYTTRITIVIDSPEPAIGFQKHSLTLPNDDFYNNIAQARMFGFTENLNSIRQPGLISNNSPESIIQFEGDEFVRNEILKIMGALALIGAPVVGHLYVHMPDQELISLLIRKMFQTPDAWSYKVDCLLPTILKKCVNPV